MRIILMRRSLLLPFLLVLLFAASNVSAQFNSEILYRLTARHSGKCLAVAGGTRSRENGNPVIQWDCSETEDNQKWQIVSVGEGYYKILSKHSGKSLDVFGGIISTGNGSRVDQWDYNGAANQLWKFVPVGDDYYEIVAKHSGKSLDINGGPSATGNGSYAQQWDYVGGSNQQWRLTPNPQSCPNLTSTLNGTAVMVLRIPNQKDRTFNQQISLSVEFTDCRRTIRITSFPPITPPEYETPLGLNTTTISLYSGGTGSFNPTSGQLELPITLGFVNTNRALGNWTLPLNLTGIEGDPFTLVGEGTFSGGYLGTVGATATVRLTGRFSPRPR